MSQTDNLTHREKEILRFVISDFIETATPIGSKFVSKQHNLDISPATIRSVMADLELRGFIDHPYTSAGRVPTDKGYRYYVESLMELSTLSEEERISIDRQLSTSKDDNEMLRETSKLLGTISRQLCVVTTPQLATGILERVELVSLSSTKLMVIISMRSGVVKTIMFEATSEISRSHLDIITSLLNERLTGLTLQQIRETFIERFRDVQSEETGLIRLFIDSVDKIFIEAKSPEKIHISGAENIIVQPEFFNPKNFRSVVELINDQEMIIHVLQIDDATNESKNVTVAIGEELGNIRLSDYGVITSQYHYGDVSGRIGVIGPKRMNYARVVPLVDYLAATVSRLLS
ncbi:MAG: heat-inducible transcription repressor HrcA [Ignavibacteriales bacterium]|nr:heat-inducible transcription repressor HrcA [Ignavibacteriales bacterium]